MRTSGGNADFPMQALLPEFCHSQIVLRIIILVQSLAILLALVPGVDSSFWPRLGFITLCLHWVSLPLLAVFCSFQRQLQHWRGRTLAGFALIIFMLSSWLVGAIAFNFLRDSGWRGADDYHSFMLQVLLIALLIGGGGLQLLVFYVNQRLRLDAQAKAEFMALQARIRPHFLFNSLNTAAELVHQDPVAAEQTMLDLAALFRAALDGEAALPLAQDLQLARQYLAVEQLRLGARLILDWQVPDRIPAVKIPSLTLQPLLENAVRHGIETRIGAGTIALVLTVGQTSVSMSISNPIGDARPHSGGNGIALANIRRRLELMYGTHARLVHNQQDGLYLLKLTLPLEKS